MDTTEANDRIPRAPWDDGLMRLDLEYPELHPLIQKVQVLDGIIKQSRNFVVTSEVLQQSARVSQLSEATEQQFELFERMLDLQGERQDLTDQQIIQVQAGLTLALNAVSEVSERIEKLADLVLQHSRVLEDVVMTSGRR